MALDTFIPSLWAASMLKPFYKNLVLGSVVNRNYEGQIRQMGDSVKINEIGSITISDYTKYDSLTWQELTSAQKTLVMDKAKSFSFAVDDIDTAQANMNVMNDAMQEAAYAIADEIDQDLADLYSDAGTEVTAVTATSGSVLTMVAEFAEALNDNNVPTGQRFLIIPPAVLTPLLLDLSGGMSATAVPKVFDNGVIANGFVGSLYGFNILVSNNLTESSSGVRQVIGLTRDAITHAGQITKIMPVQREDYFDEGVKGLYVYGSKVVKPAALATCAVTV